MNDQSNTPGREVATAGGRMHARDISIGAHGINFKNAADVMAFANMMAGSGFAVRPPFRDNPGACLAVIDDSIRFGMSPYFLARRAYLVNDQLAYESSVFAAVIITRGPLASLPRYDYAGEGVKRVCTVTMKVIPGLVDGDVIVHSSPPLGEINPKNSPLWKTDPDQQQGYYTIRAAARRHFPHVLGGAYDMQEAAAARAIDVTPRESVASRLPGKVESNGDHVERSINGEEDGEAEATETTAVDTAATASDEAADAGANMDASPDEITEDEKALISDIQKALDEAKTPDEVGVIAADYTATVEASRPNVAAVVDAMVKARVKALPKKKGKPAAASKLL